MTRLIWSVQAYIFKDSNYTQIKPWQQKEQSPFRSGKNLISPWDACETPKGSKLAEEEV